MNSALVIITAVLCLTCYTMAAPLTLIPAISDAVRTQAFDLGASDLVNLWEHGLRMQEKFKASLRDTTTPAAPKTIVSPESAYMMNLVPQDVGHPLYHDGPEYRALRHRFLLDYFVESFVDPTSVTAQGATYSNFNGKNLVFKKNSAGKTTVNDVVVATEKKLSDGTQLYVLEGLLFGHQKLVEDAFQKMQAEQSSQSFGCPSGFCR